MNLRRRNKPTRDVASAQHAPATVDGGWAWMVCFGGHLCVMLSPGYLTSLGVLYIEWKEYFALSAAGSSWIVSIPFLVASPLCKFKLYHCMQSCSLFLVLHFLHRHDPMLTLSTCQN